ncbi:M20 metallopeptidase family protein [Anaerostipes sp.]|uniref:M20 metallopeptidase family protein n=1 Tax=Anaerostipes sp. TaxID=1872530 RepID=UPI0025C19756|nr:amidohydrolase [Anaerostipes sp.]MBS7007591.1 amidohydrolase [Anaerostipes sp.]
MDIIREVNAAMKQIIQYREDLHRHPETAFKEQKTTDYIKRRLQEMKIPYTPLDPTGAVAEIGEGSRVIALRADIDALQVKEDTGCSFVSEHPGYMHACGHDGHTAILLGTAQILKKYEKELKKKILLVFQPAEETAQGAKLVLESGLLDHTDEIFGLHIFSGIEAGKISVEAGPRMAATDWFSIDISGKAGHAGKPHLCTDATVAAAAVVMNLQTIVSRNTDPLDSAVVTVGKLVSGTARNVISGHARLEGTVRTFSEDTEQMVKERVIEIACSTAKQFGGEAVADYPASSHPPLVNSVSAVKRAERGAEKVFSEDDFVHVPPMMLGEDYSNYLKTIPGAFAFVGGGTDQFPNHHGRFDMDERALLSGVKLMLAYAMEE